MKCLLTLILVITGFFSAVAQGEVYQGGIYIQPNLIEDGRYVSAFADEDGDYVAYKDHRGVVISVSHPQGRLASYQIISETISMYMFDDDDGIESVAQQGNINFHGDGGVFLMLLDDNSEETMLAKGSFQGLAQTPEGAVLVTLVLQGTGMTYHPLPGNTPEYTRKQRETNRVDTIYYKLSRISTASERLGAPHNV